MSKIWNSRYPHWIIKNHEKKELLKATKLQNPNWCYFGKYKGCYFAKTDVSNSGTHSTESSSALFFNISLKSKFASGKPNLVLVDMIQRRIFTDIKALQDNFAQLSFANRFSLVKIESSCIPTSLIDTAFPVPDASNEAPAAKKRKASSPLHEDSSTSLSEESWSLSSSETE